MLHLVLQAHHTSDDDSIENLDTFLLDKDQKQFTVNPVWLKALEASALYCLLIYAPAPLPHYCLRWSADT